jgi:hypothetical protein
MGIRNRKSSQRRVAGPMQYGMELDMGADCGAAKTPMPATGAGMTQDSMRGQRRA